MLRQLAKYASAGARLRELALEKRAGLLGAAVKTIGGAAIKNPLQTAGVAMGVGAGASGAKGKYQQYKAGFDPAVQQSMLGQPPKPPGA